MDLRLLQWTSRFKIPRKRNLVEKSKIIRTVHESLNTKLYVVDFQHKIHLVLTYHF